MIQKTIATIFVVFSLILACTTSASPIVERNPGQVVYCDFFGAMTGRITFTELLDAKFVNFVRVLGQINTGFPSPPGACTIQVGGEKPIPIPPRYIFPPGTAPYQEDFPKTTITPFIGTVLTVRCDEKIIGVSNTCKLVG